MTGRKSLLVGLLSAVAAEVTVQLNAPAIGTCNPITGSVVGMTTQAPGDFKLIAVVSGAQTCGGGNAMCWWDKMHTYYLITYGPTAEAGQAQGAGIPLAADWSFNWPTWCNPGAAQYDSTATFMRAFLLPTSFDTTYPAYQIEGTEIPGAVFTAAVAWTEVDRSSGTTSIVNGGAPPLPPASPAATPAATPVATPSASATRAHATATVSGSVLGSGVATQHAASPTVAATSGAAAAGWGATSVMFAAVVAAAVARTALPAV